MTVAHDRFDPTQIDRDDEVLAELRPRCPVVEVVPGTFLLTRYADVVRASRDPESFPQAPSRVGGVVVRAHELPLGETDAPAHGPARKMLQGVLSTRRVRAMPPAVRAVCEQVADGLAGRTRVDLVAVLARPVAARVLGDLAGVPADLQPRLHDYCAALASLTARDGADPGPAGTAAARALVEEVEARLAEVVRERRVATDRPDDAVTALVDVVSRTGKPLWDARIVAHLARDIVAGGVDPTTHLLGNLLWELLATPGAYARVRDDRSLVQVAVEETLRHLPVVRVVLRRPGEDVDVAGTTVPAGSFVALSCASANRDPAVFPHADRFDLDRGEQARQHLGFGTGPHLCLGAALARLVASEVLDVVLDRFPTMALVPGETAERAPSSTLRGPRHLHVTLAGG